MPRYSATYTKTGSTQDKEHVFLAADDEEAQAQARREETGDWTLVDVRLHESRTRRH